MPRETIHYGRRFAIVTVPPSKDHGGYQYEISDRDAIQQIEDQNHPLNADDVVFDSKPDLEVVWSRPIDKQSLPAGEEGTGSVQVQIRLTPEDMQSRINHISEHPEDLADFAQVFTESLTRRQINDMIRTLKRARDAAYGADE